jgi:hypothetical protein
MQEQVDQWPQTLGMMDQGRFELEEVLAKKFI